MSDTSIFYDLCIIGAGMFGCAAAKHATAFTKLKICLIGPEEPTIEEWERRMILSSHYDEGRIVRKHLLDDNSNALVAGTIEEFQAMEKNCGRKLFNKTGGIFLFDHDHEAVPEILKEIESGKSQLVNIFSDSVLAKKFSYMKFDPYKHAFLDTSFGYVSPREIYKTDKLIASKNGCTIVNDIVKDIKEVDPDMFEIITETQRSIKAKKLLICAGAFTNFIPMHAAQKLNITVEKESYLLIRVSNQEATRLKEMPVMDIFMENFDEQPFLKGAYILPPIKYPDGNYYLKIGHIGIIVNSKLNNLEEIKKWYHCSGEKYIYEHYLKIIQDLIPGLKIEEVVRKTCVTCTNPSNLPYIDNISPKVTVAAVGNGVGVTMCEEIGRLAAKLSVEGIWDSKLPKTLFQAVY